MGEYRFFLAGGTTRPKKVENPSPDWISERAWGEILTLESLKSFHGFASDFKHHLTVFKKIFDSPDPHRYFSLSLSLFQIIIYNCNLFLTEKAFQMNG